MGLSPGLGEAGLDSWEPQHPCPASSSPPWSSLLQAVSSTFSGVSSGALVPAGEELGTQALDGKTTGLFAAPRAESGRRALSQGLGDWPLRPPLLPAACLCMVLAHAPVCPSFQQVLIRPLEQQCLLPGVAVWTATTTCEH